MCFIIPKENYLGKVSEDEVKGFFKKAVSRGLVSKWAVPDRIVITDRRPKTSVGKMHQRSLVKQCKQ